MELGTPSFNLDKCLITAQNKLIPSCLHVPFPNSSIKSLNRKPSSVFQFKNNFLQAWSCAASNRIRNLTRDTAKRRQRINRVLRWIHHRKNSKNHQTSHLIHFHLPICQSYYSCFCRNILKNLRFALKERALLIRCVQDIQSIQYFS